MKKQLFAILLLTLFVTNANAQAKKDTAVAPQVNNETPLITIADLNSVDSILKKKINVFGKDDYDQVFRILQGLVQYRVQEFNNKYKSAAKKP
jgi:hypothetical protein